jgi:hypothetical protein
VLGTLYFSTGYQSIVQAQQNPQSPKTAQPSFDIGAKFTASGWMGGGKEGKQEMKHIQLVEGWDKNPHSPPKCVKVVYKPGENGWAGVYWQNKPDNWGKKPGENFETTGYQKLTFWARGETGTEVVEFKSGGIAGEKFQDSFEVSTGKITLGTEWQQYTIDLTDQKLSSVIGGFVWVATKSANPEGLTFYLDDIFFE